MVDGLVSIIMPSFNTAKFIGKSIESVLNQTYKNWELLIVDDCSTDNTDEIVSSYIDERIKYFKNEKNSGAALTRNKALQEANGEYIAFLDSDDLWSPEKLDKQIAFMKNNGYFFSYTNYEKIDENDKKINVVCSGPSVITKKAMYRYCYPGCLTVIYKRNNLQCLQIKNIKKNNDYAMWLSLCKLYNCYLLNEDLAQYRIRKQSISHDKLRKKLKSHYDLFRYCDERSVPVAFFFACRNIFFGILKKKKYEKTVKTKL